MDVNRLPRYALEYELKIRGRKDDAIKHKSVDELRSSLRRFLQLEVAGKLFSVSSTPIKMDSATKELKLAQEKISEIEQGMEKESPTTSDYRKWNAILTHFARRVKRISTEVSEEVDQKEAILDKILILLSGIPDGDPAAFFGKETKANRTRLNMEERTSSDSSSSGSGSEEEAAPRRPSKFISLAKNFGAKFRGDGTGPRLGHFLDEVETLRTIRGLSGDQTLRGIGELLEGPALRWYRSHIQRCPTWSSFVSRIRSDLQGEEYEEDIWDEIRGRRQKDRETLIIFVSEMLSLFEQLSRQPPEEDKVRQIIRNLKQEYQMHLRLTRPKTIEELEDLCRSIDAAQRRPDRTRVSESTGRETYRAGGRNLGRQNTRCAAMEPAREERPIACFNCGQEGHKFRGCLKELGHFCWGCGAKGVARWDCSSCQNSNRTRSGASGNGSKGRGRANRRS